MTTRTRTWGTASRSTSGDGLGEAIPLLESRERRFYVTVD
jgi:hypothetical protein